MKAKHLRQLPPTRVTHATYKAFRQLLAARGCTGSQLIRDLIERAHKELTK